MYDGRLDDVVGEITVDNRSESLDYRLYAIPFMVGFGSAVIGSLDYFSDVYSISLEKMAFKSIIVGGFVGFNFKYLLNFHQDIKFTFQQSAVASLIGAFAGLNLMNYFLK